MITFVFHWFNCIHWTTPSTLNRSISFGWSCSILLSTWSVCCPNVGGAEGASRGKSLKRTGGPVNQYKNDTKSNSKDQTMSKDNFNFKNICKENDYYIHLLVLSHFTAVGHIFCSCGKKFMFLNFFSNTKLRGGVVLETKQKQNSRITSSTNIR